MLFDAGSPAQREQGWEAFPRNLLCIPPRQAPEVTWVSPGYFPPCISSLYRLEGAILSHAPSSDLVPPQLSCIKQSDHLWTFGFLSSHLHCSTFVLVEERGEHGSYWLPLAEQVPCGAGAPRGKSLLWTEARFTRG